VLPELSGKLGVTLRAASETADQKVSLVVKERPAIDVLTQLAAHLDFLWLKQGDRYELAQSVAAKRREQALRDEERLARLAAIEERMRNLSQMTGRSPEQLQARMLELRAQLPGAATQQRPALQRELELVSDAARPGAGPAVALFRALAPGQWQQVLAGAELRFSSQNNTLPSGMSDQIHQAATSRAGGGMMVLSAAVRAGGGGAAPPAPLFGTPSESLPPLSAEATLQIRDSHRGRFGGGIMAGSLSGAGPRPQLDVTLTSTRGTEQQRRSVPVIWSPQISDEVIGEIDEPTQTRDSALLQTVELKLPEPPVAPVSPRTVMLRGTTPPGRVPLGRVLEALSAASGLDVLADDFVRARMDPTRLRGKRPLVELLDEVARSLRYAWSKEDGVLRLRDRRFFTDRPAEVPERLLEPWRAALKTRGAPTLDELGSVAATLSDPQLIGLETYWGWYLDGIEMEPLPPMSGLYDSRHHLRFWSTLSGAQKQLVGAGKPLPVSQMGVPQRQAFATAFASPRSEFLPRLGPEMPGNAASPQELAAGAFSLSRQELQRQMFSAPGGNGVMVMNAVQSIRRVGPNGQAGGLPNLPGGLGGLLPRALGTGGQPGAPQPPGAPGRATVIGPDGKEMDLGNPISTAPLDAFVFNYHLAGNPEPARTASIQIPRPLPKAP
jgi:hypothetical protein